MESGPVDRHYAVSAAVCGKWGVVMTACVLARVDRDLRIVSARAEMPEQFIGRNVADIVHPGESAAICQAFRDAIRRRKLVYCDCVTVQFAEQYERWSLRIAPLCEGRKVAGALVTAVRRRKSFLPYDASARARKETYERAQALSSLLPILTRFPVRALDAVYDRLMRYAAGGPERPLTPRPDLR